MFGDTYDGSGNPVSVLDITNQIEYTYVYENGRLLCEMQSEGAYIDANGFKHPGTLKCKTVYRYNSKGNVAEKTFYDADGSIADKFVYTDDENTTVTLPTGAKVRSRSDKLGRLEFDEVQTGSGALSRRFAYVEGSVPEEYENEGKVLSAPTTNLVERISYSDGDKLEYTYDAEERITSVKGKYTSAYEYDCHGQLTGEAFTDADGKINITEITYDTAGNIRTKGGKLYEYDSTWKDLLIKYDGKNIYYDALGNPTTYLGNVLTWTTGRKLESFGDTISYKYNSLGHRIAKTVGDTEHEYFYEGNRLIKEVRTDTDGTVHTLVFLYDASDSPIGMQYDGTAYYYKKNLQGDVIALLDANCNTIAEYVYDAWGALRTINADTLLNTLIAALNPIRYRGYYYDNETGFYFLQSRYYDPIVGRFINADDTLFLGMSGTVCSYNLFAYCENDSVNHSDPLGIFVIATFLSYGFSVFVGLQASAIRIIDGYGNTAIIISWNMLNFFALRGGSWGIGFYWGYDSIDDYLEANDLTWSVFVLTIANNHPNYPKDSNINLVGLGLNFATAGVTMASFSNNVLVIKGTQKNPYQSFELYPIG